MTTTEIDKIFNDPDLSYDEKMTKLSHIRDNATNDEIWDYAIEKIMLLSIEGDEGEIINI